MMRVILGIFQLVVSDIVRSKVTGSPTAARTIEQLYEMDDSDGLFPYAERLLNGEDDVDTAKIDVRLLALSGVMVHRGHLILRDNAWSSPTTIGKTNFFPRLDHKNGVAVTSSLERRSGDKDAVMVSSVSKRRVNNVATYKPKKVTDHLFLLQPDAGRDGVYVNVLYDGKSGRNPSQSQGTDGNLVEQNKDFKYLSFMLPLGPKGKSQLGKFTKYMSVPWDAALQKFFREELETYRQSLLFLPVIQRSPPAHDAAEYSYLCVAHPLIQKGTGNRFGPLFAKTTNLLKKAVGINLENSIRLVVRPRKGEQRMFNIAILRGDIHGNLEATSDKIERLTTQVARLVFVREAHHDTRYYFTIRTRDGRDLVPKKSTFEPAPVGTAAFYYGSFNMFSRNEIGEAPTMKAEKAEQLIAKINAVDKKSS